MPIRYEYGMVDDEDAGVLKWRSIKITKATRYVWISSKIIDGIGKVESITMTHEAMTAIARWWLENKEVV